MDEKTALEEIQYIRKVIEESKRTVLYNGIDYIFWGILIVVAMVLQYYVVAAHYYFNFIWLWAVAIGTGWIFSIYNAVKHHKRTPRTYASKLIKAVWGGGGIAMTLIGFVGTTSGSIHGLAISPLISLLLGSAYLVTGEIVGSSWMKKLSIGWWAGAVILFFVRDINQFLIMAAMMLFLQTIPGIMIYRKYKKEAVLAS